MEKKNYETVVSRDIYELAYFLSKTECKIELIRLNLDLDKPACIVTISGENLNKLQLDYLNSNAPVDAVSYRKSLSYIRSLVYGEISKYRKEHGRLDGKKSKKGGQP